MWLQTNFRPWDRLLNNIICAIEFISIKQYQSVSKKKSIEFKPENYNF